MTVLEAFETLTDEQKERVYLLVAMLKDRKSVNVERTLAGLTRFQKRAVRIIISEVMKEKN